jgi:hypothetical protein
MAPSTKWIADMRKLAVLLSVVAIGLAIACIHLYRELQAARSRADQAIAASRDVKSEAAADVEQPIFANEMPSPAEPQAPSPRDTQSPIQQQRPTQDTQATSSARREQRRAELQQRWSDPTFRARALQQAKTEARHWHPDVGSALRLNAQEEAALIDLLAQQRLQIREANEPMRFATDTERKQIQQTIDTLAERHQQELAAFLGPRFQEYGQYTRQVPERREVQELRAKLDEANALSASQSARLVSAMYEERDSYLQQIKTLENLGSYSPQYPVLAMPDLRADPQARLRFVEEQMGRTQEFMNRVRQRAATILSAEQLRRFDEMQEEQRASSQRVLERMRNQANRAQQRRRQ